MQDKKTKRDQAEARRELRRLRSHKQQLATLDARLGDGVGAKRERARVAKQREQAATAARKVA